MTGRYKNINGQRVKMHDAPGCGYVFCHAPDQPSPRHHQSCGAAKRKQNTAAAAARAREIDEMFASRDESARAFIEGLA